MSSSDRQCARGRVRSKDWVTDGRNKLIRYDKSDTMYGLLVSFYTEGVEENCENQETMG